jgi:hypothetical protein
LFYGFIRASKEESQSQDSIDDEESAGSKRMNSSRETVAALSRPS